MLAGAIVADAVMDLMGVTQLEICPWALREGVILKRLDVLADPDTRHLTGPMRTFPS
jgi:exopolyphosphatase/guanosine-5'-triphosphate,3'-diphosphate pyrophosphatase